MKAIIPAAGLGTRFLPATKAVPKEMLPVLDKPTIQYVVEEALAAEADEVVLVINQSKQAIVEHFTPNEPLALHLEAAGKPQYAAAVRQAGALPVSYVQQPQPGGLGQAVHCAAELVGDEPFYVLLGDVIVPDAAMLPAMLALSREHGGASVIAVFAVPREQVSRFGVIGGELLSGGADGIGPAGGESSAGAQPDAAEQFSADEQPGAGEQPGAVWRITELTEKPPVDLAPSNLAIFGRYLLSPRVMELLAHTAPGAGGEIQLTDAMVQLLEEEEMYALVIDNNAGFDVGTIETWLDTNNRLNR